MLRLLGGGTISVQVFNDKVHIDQLIKLRDSPTESEHSLYFILLLEIGFLSHVTQTTGLEGEENTGLEGEANTGLGGEAKTGLEGEANTGLEGEANTGLGGEENTGLEGEANTGFEGEANTGLEGEANTGLEGEANTGLGGEANTGLEGEANTGRQILAQIIKDRAETFKLKIPNPPTVRCLLQLLIKANISTGKFDIVLQRNCSNDINAAVNCLMNGQDYTNEFIKFYHNLYKLFESGFQKQDVISETTLQGLLSMMLNGVSGFETVCEFPIVVKRKTGRIDIWMHDESRRMGIIWELKILKKGKTAAMSSATRASTLPKPATSSSIYALKEIIGIAKRKKAPYQEQFRQSKVTNYFMVGLSMNLETLLPSLSIATSKDSTGDFVCISETESKIYKDGFKKIDGLLASGNLKEFPE